MEQIKILKLTQRFMIIKKKEIFTNLLLFI